MLRHETPKDAAAISYFTLLSLFPASLVLIAITDAFLGWLNLHKLVVREITGLFPGSRAFLQTNLSELTDPSSALLLSCLGVVVWSAGWILEFVEDGLNRAWHIKRRRSFWESRVRSIALMVLGGLMLFISAIMTAVVSTLQARARAYIPGGARAQIISWVWSVILIGSGFLMAVLVFFLIYKLLPHRKVPWHEALSGSAVASILWHIGNYVFAWLVPIFDYQRVYGKMGAIIALLTWVYTLSLITLFGANFSAQLHRPESDQMAHPEPTRDSRQTREPKENKVRVFPRQS